MEIQWLLNLIDVLLPLRPVFVTRHELLHACVDCRSVLSDHRELFRTVMPTRFWRRQLLTKPSNFATVSSSSWYSNGPSY